MDARWKNTFFMTALDYGFRTYGHHSMESCIMAMNTCRCSLTSCRKNMPDTSGMYFRLMTKTNKWANPMKYTWYMIICNAFYNSNRFAKNCLKQMLFLEKNSSAVECKIVCPDFGIIRTLSSSVYGVTGTFSFTVSNFVDHYRKKHEKNSNDQDEPADSPTNQN